MNHKMEAKKNISFRLLNIVTEQFATFEIENQSEEGDLRTDLQFSINAEKRVVVCKMNFQFLFNQQPAVVLNVICNFDVEETSWNNQIIADKKITLPKHFLEHLCVITLGTARGILHTKTENTSFNRYIIPVLNVSTLVEKDVVLEIK